MSLPFETSDDFFLREEVVAEYASFDFLLEPERAIIDALGDLSDLRVLDLGVGGGRTASPRRTPVTSTGPSFAAVTRGPAS